MSEILTAKNYTWRKGSDEDEITHGKKSEYWHTLEKNIAMHVTERFLVQVATGFPTDFEKLHIYIMNILYHSTSSGFDCKTVIECMLQTMVHKLWGLMNGPGRTRFNSIFLHCDSPSAMIRQKKYEQRRRAQHRGERNIELRRHGFDEEFKFSCSEITAHQ